MENDFSCQCKNPYYGQRCDKECKCKNGECKDDGTGSLRCTCLPEFGLYGKTECRECKCGKNANCTFEEGFWPFSDNKYCLCPNGEKLENKPCKEETTSSEIPTTTIDSTKVSRISTDPTRFTIINPTSVPSTFSSDFYNETSYSPPNSTAGVYNFTTFEPRNSTLDIYNFTTFEPRNSTGDIYNFTTFDPRNSTGDIYNFTTFDPRNSTGDIYDFTTSEPRNSTGDIYNFTTFEPRNSTRDIYNFTTFEPRNSTRDIYNFTTFEPRNSTGDIYNFTTFEPRNSTGDIYNFTTFEPRNSTRDIYNFTTHDPSAFTENFNMTSLEPNNYTLDFNYTTHKPSDLTIIIVNETTAELLNITDTETPGTTLPVIFTSSGSSISTYTASSTDSVSDHNTLSLSTTDSSSTFTLSSQPTSQEPDVKTCKELSCQNGGTCVKTNGQARCKCVYPFGGKTCADSYWCAEGMGKTVCAEAKCQFNFTSRIGRCECPSNQYYNYEEMICEDVDQCPFMLGKCTGEHEICQKSICQCEKNFTRDSNNKCVPNFCASNPSPCGENELCEDVETNPGNVKCTCKDNFYFDGKSCEKGNKCYLSSTLGCQQLCNNKTEKCDCYEGFTLQSDEKSCKPKRATLKCKKNCGVGTCFSSKSKETCICPVSHIFNGKTCIDMCAADSIPRGLCPNDQCISDSKLGFKCKCDGKLTYAENGITCRRRLMCTEGNGTQSCAAKGAYCIEDLTSNEGYSCECEKGKGKDTDGHCKKKCELPEYQRKCGNLLAVCDMDRFEAICKCPPLMTFGEDKKCTALAKESYSAPIPLSWEKYISNKALSENSLANQQAEFIEYDIIRKDLRDSMHLLYGTNYKFADVLNCNSSGGNLKCLVELQFHSDSKDQVNLFGQSDTCIPNTNGFCYIPPALLLKKKELKPVTFAETDPCMDEIKMNNCGANTHCSKLEDHNYKCTCKYGYSSFKISHPVSDTRTVIEYCEDDNECLKAKACPNRTRCFNTEGSYACFCLEGFKPKTLKSDPKFSGCVEICSAEICKHGQCEIISGGYRCRCHPGYVGLNCDEEEVTVAGFDAMRVALIILSVVVVPLLLFAVFVTFKYRVLRKRTFKSNYLDDQSSTINLQPMGGNEK